MRHAKFKGVIECMYITEAILAAVNILEVAVADVVAASCFVAAAA